MTLDCMKIEKNLWINVCLKYKKNYHYNRHKLRKHIVKEVIIWMPKLQCSSYHTESFEWSSDTNGGAVKITSPGLKGNL